MKKPILGVLTLMLGLGQAVGKDGNLEQRVFSETGKETAPAVRKPVPRPASPLKPGERKLGNRDSAKRMYERFVNGDSMYVTLLKNDANKGNPWSALQYGYLAHRGKIPGSHGADHTLAHKAYMMAVKNPKDGSLTANHLAAYNLGLLYYYGGGGIKPDGRTALRWFRTSSQGYREQKSASSVFWPAALYIAQILESGYGGVAADAREARVYWQQAANARDPSGMYGYARSISRENPYAAIPYYTRAADRWHTGAMVALAHFYAKGNVKPNLVEATRWMRIAAMADGRYRGNAKRMMALLPKAQQQKVDNAVRMWLQRRGVKPTPFDYAAPLNDDPPRNL